MIWAHVVVLVALLGCSAMFSGSETALFALSRHQLYRFGRSGGRLGRMVAQLMQQPREVLLTVLIANTTVNVLIFANGYVLSRRLGGTGLLAGLLGGLGSVLAVVVFGEVLPKAVAYARAERLAPLAAPLIRTSQAVFRPLQWVLNGLIVEPLTRLLLGAEPPLPHVTTEELRMLLAVSERGGVIDADESAMLQQIVSLAEWRVRDVMVPRVDVQAFDVDGDPEQLRQMMCRTKLKKVPIYEHDIDHIVGLIYAKELFLDGCAPARSLRQLLRPVRFVPEQMKLAQLLEHFRQTRTQLAIVVDEYGGMAGLVTLEDAVEQIVGDIADADEPDKPPPVQALDERTFLVSGGLSIRDWAGVFGVRVLDERVTTVGGLVLSRLGRIPKVGDAVRLANLELTVERMRGRRIDLLRVELLEQASAAAPPADRHEASAPGSATPNDAPGPPRPDPEGPRAPEDRA